MCIRDRREVRQVDADRPRRRALSDDDIPVSYTHLERDVLVDRLLKELVFGVLEHQPHLEAVFPQVGLLGPQVGDVYKRQG